MRSDAGYYINLKLFVLSQIGFLIRHRFTFQIDSIRIVNEPIQDGISNSRIADSSHASDRLAADWSQALIAAVTIFEDFQEVMTQFISQPDLAG
jgi:hypothetical protein